MKRHFMQKVLVCLVAWGGVILPTSAQTLTDFEQKLADMGIVKDELTDLSDEESFSLATPNCAYLNITGVSQMPWSKTDAASIDMHATVEVYDCEGHYFEKKVLLNAQGNSSMNYVKKNFALDFCEDEWVGDKTTAITIGNWVEQDAFHFKAYYLDGFRGTANVGYKLFEQMEADHDSYLVRGGFEDNGARCYPDGFPCIVYLNGKFYGVFAWNLKKHRANMNHTKDNPNHIQLDGTLRATLLGNIQWDQFEVRNPKTLYCTNQEEVSGYIYQEITDNEAELATMGENYVEAPSNPKDMASDELDASSPLYYRYVTSKGKIKFYKLIEQSGYVYAKYNGDYPVELIDETMPYYDANNKSHVMTAQVKANIKKLCGYYTELKRMENAGATDADMRAAFEERFDAVGMVDYMVFGAITNNYDGFNKNWQWFTWDGDKWFVAPYDLDGTFGNYWSGTILYTADWNESSWGKFSSLAINSQGPMYFIARYYYDDIVERYTELRESGVLTADNIMSHFRQWSTAVTDANYQKEWQKWPKSPCHMETILNANWTTEDDWTNYGTTAAYDATKTYQAGDKCTYRYRIFTATGTTTGVAPASQMGYMESLDRVETWVNRRIELADQIATYTADDMMSSYTMNISSATWGTVCVPFSFRIPDGVTLYGISGVNDDEFVINKKTEEYSEANKPYLVHGPQGMYLLQGMKEDIDLGLGSGATEEEIAEAQEQTLTNGLLKGTYENIYVPMDKYVLQNQNGVLAFYRVAQDNNIRLQANRAYLTLPDMGGAALAKARMYNLFEEGETNDIENIVTESNDRIVGIYNVNGVSVGNFVNGINVVKYADGRTEKVFVK